MPKACLKICLLGAAVPLLLATHAVGAVISWQTPVSVDVNDASQILTNGTFVGAGAAYADSYGPLTVNGVDFSYSGIYGNGNHFYLSAASAGGQNGPATTDYSKILTLSYPLLNSTAVSSPMIIFGLTSGQTYEFQVWVGYWPYNYSTRFSTGVPDGATNSTATNESGTLEVGNFAGPSFVVGTFVADATTQNIYYYGNGGAQAGEGMISAYQLRAVPEPQTWALAALGVSAVLFRLRRKQRTT